MRITLPLFRPAALTLSALLLGTALPGAARAEVPDLVIDLPAPHALAAQVMEGVGTPVLLLDRGASPHHYQLRPSQARALEGADLVLWTGPGATPWMERATGALADADKVMRLDEVTGIYTRTFGEGAEGHDHAHDEDHDDHDAEDHDAHHEEGHDDHDHDDHDHEDGHDEDGHEGHHHGAHDLDPHLWLDPGNAQLWLGALADRLSALDPEHEAQYRANASAAQERIRTQETEIRAALTPVADQDFAVFHDAYGYFTTHFGLQPAHALSLGDAAPASLARMTELRDELTEHNIRCAFPEVQHDPASLERLVEGTDTRLGPAIDPSGSSLEPGAALYATLMGNLAEALSTCLSK